MLIFNITARCGFGIVIVFVICIRGLRGITISEDGLKVKIEDERDDAESVVVTFETDKESAQYLYDILIDYVCHCFWCERHLEMVKRNPLHGFCKGEHKFPPAWGKFRLY